MVHSLSLISLAPLKIQVCFQLSTQHFNYLTSAGTLSSQVRRTVHQFIVPYDIQPLTEKYKANNMAKLITHLNLISKHTLTPHWAAEIEGLHGWQFRQKISNGAVQIYYRNRTTVTGPGHTQQTINTGSHFCTTFSATVHKNAVTHKQRSLKFAFVESTNRIYLRQYTHSKHFSRACHLQITALMQTPPVGCLTEQ